MNISGQPARFVWSVSQPAPPAPELGGRMVGNEDAKNQRHQLWAPVFILGRGPSFHSIPAYPTQASGPLSLYMQEESTNPVRKKGELPERDYPLHSLPNILVKLPQLQLSSRLDEATHRPETETLET